MAIVLNYESGRPNTEERQMTDRTFDEYAHPEMLVSTDWLADHLGDPDVVVVESDEDVLLYETGHIPGAVKIDWQADLNDATELRTDAIRPQNPQKAVSSAEPHPYILPGYRHENRHEPARLSGESIRGRPPFDSKGR